MKPNNILDATENECTWLKSSLKNRVELLEKTNAGLIYVDDSSWIPKKLFKTKNIVHRKDPKRAILNEFYDEGYSTEKGLHRDMVIYIDYVEFGVRFNVGALSVIGGEGFGYADNKKLPHIGKVIIGNNVDIGANCCIDRGCLDNTVIGDNVKIDNLVHIAHSVKIGKKTKIAAHTMIAGSVTIGEDVWIGPSVSIINGVTIGDDAYIGIGTNIITDVPAGETWCGNPGKKLR